MNELTQNNAPNFMKKLQNILITGSNGQLGRCLQDAVCGGRYAVSDTSNFFFTDIEELDITDICAVSDFVYENKIDCIINAAAYTAVDNAEDESEEAFDINATGVWVVSHICMEQNVFLIHISTDYVFDGNATAPYKPNARPNPVSVYGKSKLAGEQAILDDCSPSVIIRTSWLYSQYGHNFLNTMLKLGKEKKDIYVVDDQYGAPTNAHNLADVILNIIEQKDKIKRPTVFHYANEGVTTWCGFAKEIMKMAQLPCVVHPITTTEYSTKAKRPAYSVLELSKIKKQFKIKIPDWTESLQRELSLIPNDA
ncbi:MAG: dTDP-4-dehydrorhamnose reductase [Bacteroidetes bacterium]|nr:dTDP-4-dehydrorhamnose reductase [Bacteroidota bacterium]MCL1968901.1 dTDP-4-dehydrorhamnose reductase [Bacteroidota bacterium]MCL1969016.1 dTDP-4-dehydrorhamnose reductase [Bacteroidota bacterium]